MFEITHPTATFTYDGIRFSLFPYRPRNNEFEKGLKYELYRDDPEWGTSWSTGFKFSSIKEAQQWAKSNALIMYG